MEGTVGKLDPSLFFRGLRNGIIGPGTTVKGRAAHYSHWEQPYAEWQVSVISTSGGLLKTLTARVVLQPAPLEPFFYESGREAVLAVPDGSGPFPALLIIHPYGSSGPAMGWAALEAVANGWVGMAISLPGFGRSLGPWDYAGPDSQQAAVAALNYLQQHPSVDARRIAVWGISLGAMVAGLVAARSELVAAAVLQAGVYDLHLQQRLGKLKWIESTGIKAGGDDWLTSRSVAARASQIQCPVLIIHGSKDTIAPVQHAHRLQSLMVRYGLQVDLAQMDGFGHGLPPRRVWASHLVPFLRKIIGPSDITSTTNLR